MSRLTRLVAVLCLGAAAVSCSSSGSHDRAVRSAVVTAPSAPQMRVLAPEGKGPWPVVFALHGFQGSGQDMVELGTHLAKRGVLVFAPTYATDLSTTAGMTRATDDIVCAYQEARRLAPTYGGDLHRPLAVVGWSLGADFVVLGSLGPAGSNSGRCPGDVPRPQAVVAIAGCYYQFQGRPVTWFDDLTGWSNQSAAVHLVDGARDTTCPAAQTDRLATALRTAGYSVTVNRLAGADHPAPVFRTERDGKSRVIKDDPAGDKTVDVILAAVSGQPNPA